MTQLDLGWVRASGGGGESVSSCILGVPKCLRKYCRSVGGAIASVVCCCPYAGGGRDGEGRSLDTATKLF